MVLLFSDSLYSPDSFTPEISTVGSFFLELFLNGFVNLLVFFCGGKIRSTGQQGHEGGVFLRMF